MVSVLFSLILAPGLYVILNREAIRDFIFRLFTITIAKLYGVTSVF